MANVFHLNISSQEKTIYDANVVSLIVPAESGYMGVLANHAPLIASLVPGKVTIKEESGDLNTIDLSSEGFLEVLKNNVTVLLT
ncbi:MAG: F0F1 ATP synthase subunit epsilon [Candidatus Omnitrophica bacterium]|nr:F0F1 ATP synthase subunit epsilon [Candidatus Omnitrophota bacterium]